MRIIEFYQCHTEIIQAWDDLFQCSKQPIEVYLASVRDFKVFESAMRYRPLEELSTPLDQHEQYLINTTRVELKKYPLWRELALLEATKFLVFHSFQEFDYFRGQNPDLIASRWVTPIFLCPAIRSKLSHIISTSKYLQLIPLARPLVHSPHSDTLSPNKLKYLVIGRLDFRIRDYVELIKSLQQIQLRDDWTCVIIGAVSRDEDYHRLIRLIREARLTERVRVLPNCPTAELQLQMSPHVDERIYLLPLIKKRSYYIDILTGSIPLSMSNGIPMILDRQLAQIYQIKSAIIYYCLSDGIQRALNLAPLDYQGLVREYHETCEQIYLSNVSIFINIVAKLGNG